MTATPPRAPANTAIAAGNGFAIGPAGVPVLDVDDVSKTYPGEPPVEALREVNLTIGPGELVGIVGPSGSGKTTLLQLMGTLDRPTSGRVRITGLDVAAMADDDVAYLRATRIGFVFQQFFLAEHATVLDNVADGLLYAGVPLGQRRRARPRRPRAGRPGRASPCPSYPALGRATPTRRDRAGPGRPARDRAGRRADREPRPGHRPAILALIDQLHQAGSTIVVITHDHAIAERMPRKVEILDGQIVADTGPAADTDLGPPTEASPAHR